MDGLEISNNEQGGYWAEFTELKFRSLYIRNYRECIKRWETGTAIVRAVASTGSIAAWAVWKEYAFIWAVIIAVSQVADALKNVFPFQQRRRALSKWCNALDKLFVLAQKDWDDIADGKLSNSQIRKVTHQVRLKMQSYQTKYAPDGFAADEKFKASADQEANAFFATRYGVR